VLINVLGSFVIGWFGGLTGPGGRIAASESVRAFVMVGLCGGFTTFSSFSLQSVELLRAGYAGRAAGNVVASVLLCLLATILGLRLSQH
jgi:CrcB protein